MATAGMSRTKSGKLDRETERKMARQNPFWYRGTYFDYMTMFLVIFLFLFGLIMIMSAGSYQGVRDDADSTYYFRRQLIMGLIGLTGMFFLSHFQYQVLKNWSLIMLIGTIILMGIVLVAGSGSRGSTRWLNIGIGTFQPSELAKLTLAIYMAHICTAKSRALYNFWKTVLYMIPPGIALGLIALENLSTALVTGMIVALIWLVATPRKWFGLIVLIIGLAGAYFFVGQKEYRQERFKVWDDPESVEKGQTIEGLYAIGSGGLFGRGLGQSILKKGSVPEAHNDMIYAIICEELGIVGGIMVIVVFGMLIWRMRFIAEGAPDRFGALLVVGAICHIALQVIINIGVVTNVFPNTGCTLPFISYGGSSLVFTLCEAGIVLSVSRQIVPLSKQEEEVAG